MTEMSSMNGSSHQSYQKFTLIFLIALLSLVCCSSHLIQTQASTVNIHDHRSHNQNDLSPIEPGLVEIESSQAPSPAASAFTSTPSTSSSSSSSSTTTTSTSNSTATTTTSSLPKSEDPSFDPAKRTRSPLKRRMKSGWLTNPEQEEEVLSWSETFSFASAKTSEGHVLFVKKGLTVEGLAELCHSTKHCTAFTTAGELKSFVPAKAKWTEMKIEKDSLIDSELQGLYYRPQWFRYAPVPCVCGSSPLLNVVCTDPGSADDYLGAALQDWSCYNPKPFLARHTCPAKTCAPIAWKTGEWSGCASCGVSVNTRTVTCEDDKGSKFDEKYCYEGGARPAEREACSATGVACEWKAQSLGCKSPCGKGLESFNVTCMSPVDQAAVPEALCTQHKPPLQKSCRNQDCAWSTTPNGECSAKCGPGRQPLKSVCINPTDPTQSLADDQCDNIPRPKGLQKCNERKCAWESTPVGSCSTSCGRGLQPVKSTCVDPITKQRQLDKQCTDSPPTSHTACEVRACVWGLTPFGRCSVECGSGIQHFNATCQDPVTRHVVAPSLCSGKQPNTKPVKCDMHDCHWRSKAITDCSAACGKGSQDFKVWCVDPVTGKALPDSHCKSMKPNTTRECQERSCEWKRERKGECSAACGTGLQSFTVECVNPKDGKRQADERCNDSEKPTLVQPCVAAHKCRWNVQLQGKCNAVCGEGSVNRTVTCIDPITKKRQPDSSCTAARPDEEVKCYDRPCVWTATPFGQCSVPCGDGVQSLNVTCTDPTGRIGVDDEKCRPELQPQPTQPCHVRDCKWNAQPNEDCSATCGPGTRTVTVTCVDPLTKKPQNETQCSGTKPTDSLPCQLKPCSWETDTVSKCSQPCGEGVAKVTHKCVDPITKKQFNATHSCANVPKPAAQLACYVRDCQWKRDWNECPSKCGGSIQTANMTCQDIDGSEVPNTQCRTSPKSWRLCNTEACSEFNAAIAYLPLNELAPVTGSGIANLAPNSDKATANGAGLLSVAGAFALNDSSSRAIRFSASEDANKGSAVVLPPNGKFQSSSFSISFRLQLLEALLPGRQYILFDNRGVENGGEGYVLFMDPKDDQIYFNDAFNAQTNTTHFANNGLAITVDGKFHHITLTYDGKTGELAFYHDGKLTSPKAPTHKFFLSTNVSEHSVFVRGSPDPYWRYPTVALQDFAFFDYPLNEKQIKLASDLPKDKNTCAAREELSVGGCIPAADPARVLDAACDKDSVKGSHSIQSCLLPLWNMYGCSSLGFGYPATETSAQHFNSKTWKEVKAEIKRAANDDVDDVNQAGKRYGICKNRQPSPLDTRCNHPPPYSLTSCLQAYFLDMGCDRAASAFPMTDNVGWNKLSWAQIKHRMSQLPALDKRGNNEYGTCRAVLE